MCLAPPSSKHWTPPTPEQVLRNVIWEMRQYAKRYENGDPWVADEAFVSCGPPGLAQPRIMTWADALERAYPEAA